MKDINKHASSHFQKEKRRVFQFILTALGAADMSAMPSFQGKSHSVYSADYTYVNIYIET